FLWEDKSSFNSVLKLFLTYSQYHSIRQSYGLLVAYGVLGKFPRDSMKSAKNWFAVFIGFLFAKAGLDILSFQRIVSFAQYQQVLLTIGTLFGASVGIFVLNLYRSVKWPGNSKWFL